MLPPLTAAVHLLLSVGAVRMPDLCRPTCKTCCLLLDAFTTRIQCKHRAVPNLLLCGTSSAVLRLVVILTATTPALESVGMFEIFFN
jgi:hypothetical protein